MLCECASFSVRICKSKMTCEVFLSTASTSILALGNRSRDLTQAKTPQNQDIVLAPGNRVRDLPEWSQDLTENLEDEGVPASRDTPANTSQDSDSERPAKVVSRKQQYPCSLPERPRNCEMQENQDYKGSLQEAHWRFDNNRSQKSLMKDVNLETITGTQSWCRTWPPNGCDPVRAKKTSWKIEISLRKILELTESQKSLKQTFLWNLASLVKNYHGNASSVQDRRIAECKEYIS